ncbi:MAG: hypothetical protein LKI93_03315 [Bifidobacteriaceae bacterium]|nr:hypothetical protein [Bifidobacteriaceae bacterium]MCI1915011.1 hypothetical protein [Bifidobacteriaceae bacterium]
MSQASQASDDDITSAFPQLAHLDELDDAQRAEAFTSVLDQLHHTLDDVTGR